MTDREAIEALTDKTVVNPYLTLDALEIAIDALRERAERKTGKWKKILIATVPFTIYGYECPFCEFRTAANTFNYCPHCGEKVEVEE